MRLPFSLCLAALLSFAACASAPPMPSIPPEECPAPWPGASALPAFGQVAITFKNELSATFGLQRVVIGLDGAALCWRNKPSDSDEHFLDADSIPTLSGPLQQGDHVLQLFVAMRGRGDGDLAYLNSYRFEVRSNHSFTAVEGKTINLRVVAYEKGGVSTPTEQRPAIRYVEQIKDAPMGRTYTQ
jgi:hypothetical protein